MTRFTNRKFMNSVKNAAKGLVITIKSQRNFKIQILIAFFITFVSFLFKYSALEFCVAILTIMLVMIVEMLNSCIEFALDAIYRNNYSILVKMSKDISAGAVLLASLTCAGINCVIFISKFI